MRTFVRPETTYFRILEGVPNNRKSKDEIWKFCKYKNQFCKVSKKHKGYTINIYYGIILNDNMKLDSEINDGKRLGAIYS